MASHLGEILQAWADEQPLQPVTDAAIGRALGVTRQTVSNWKAGLARLPEPHQLRKIATLTGRTYQEVLEAALVDTEYLKREGLAGDLQMPPQFAAYKGKKRGRGFDSQAPAEDVDL